MNKILLVFILLIAPGFLMAQEVNGTVSDSSGEPIPGVNISEKNTNNGTITDFDGNYTLSLIHI